MNLKTGVDLIEVKRIHEAIERHGERFLQRVYTPRELEICTVENQARMNAATLEGTHARGYKRGASASTRVGLRVDIKSLAARFATKEAVAKALGTGIGAVSFQEIEILRDENHTPVLYLHGAANQLAVSLGLENWSISLSHIETHAIAMVVALGG